VTAPLVGITTRRLPASALGKVPAGVVDAPIEGVFADYAESVANAGGVPVLIPRSADAARVVARLDGLVLSGGEDVHPSRYGAETGPNATKHDPDRDAFEASLVAAALDAGVPILAICRGVQILNVALGGTLVEHLEIRDGLDHSTTDQPRSTRRHDVVVEPGCMLASALGEGVSHDRRARVNSYHHQAIDEPGAGLTVIARADDGTIEAVEDPNRRILGVQWHPEMHEGVDPVFTWFVQFVADHTADRKGTA
jgi:putative glutamine amidotransferase